jgi:3-methyladenine DNA glycosylase/8-oxoguanine DNA glycosylase
LLNQVPSLLGEHDDWSQLDLSSLPKLADLLRRFPGMRLPASGRIFDSLVPAILEQRVTGMEARRAWRQLVYRFGTPAPGPVSRLRVPPSPQTLLRIPTWDWHRFGVDGQRQRAIRAAASVAGRLEECVDLSLDDAMARLQYIPGIGIWTAAETAQRALGHPDAVSVGDFHLANVVVHNLTGSARGTDEQMLELLEPWRGQRQRVVRLIEMSPGGPPKFGPRYSPLDTRAM